MAIKSQTRRDELAANEAELLEEIERLRDEVDRLSRQLNEERLDRSVQNEVKTVLSTLVHPATGEATDGRHLPDGRFLPGPQTVGGTVRPAEPGAPRVMGTAGTLAGENIEAGLSGSCEFGPGDELAHAFDQFFNAPDPHLDKMRRFLLD